MASSVTNTTSVPAHLSYKNKKEFTTDLDQNAFMKLLLEQLKNQDPMSPMDNSQFIQQTSMMTMVEKLTKMAQLMEESNSSLLSLREYEGLIGKTASYEKETKDELTGDITREQKTGVIQSVKMDKGKIYFQIGEDALIPRDKIDGLESKGLSSGNLMENSLKYAEMIGKQVDYQEARQVDKDGDPNTTQDITTVYDSKSGVILGYTMKDGVAQFQLDNGKTLKLEEMTGISVKPDNLPMDNTLKYAQMIGYGVTYLEKETQTDGSTTDKELTGVIQSVSMKNGLVEFLLEDGKKLKLHQIIGFEAPVK
jgi:flagellar basal-body rod modification protein FlgD